MFYRVSITIEGLKRVRQAFMMLDAVRVAVSPSNVWRCVEPERAYLGAQWNGKRRGKEGASSSLWNRISIGISTFPTSIFPARFTTSEPCSTSYSRSDRSLSFARVHLQGGPMPRSLAYSSQGEIPGCAQPRMISAIGPQFSAKDFKEFIRLSGMTLREIVALVSAGRTPKLERWHKSLKGACMRTDAPESRDARSPHARSRDPWHPDARSPQNAVVPRCVAPPCVAPPSLTFGVTMALPGETDAGSAGKQPCRGIARRDHRDDDRGRGSHLSRSTQNPIGSKDPDALKIPARRAASTLARNAPSPVPAEPAHHWIGFGIIADGRSCCWS